MSETEILSNLNGMTNNFDVAREKGVEQSMSSAHSGAESTSNAIAMLKNYVLDVNGDKKFQAGKIYFLNDSQDGCNYPVQIVSRTAKYVKFIPLGCTWNDGEVTLDEQIFFDHARGRRFLKKGENGTEYFNYNKNFIVQSCHLCIPDWNSAKIKHGKYRTVKVTCVTL